MDKTNEIKKIVDDLINEQPILMDRFDASYLADFHHILRENFGIENLESERLSKLVKLVKLKKTNAPGDLTIKLLGILDENDYQPQQSTDGVKAHHKYDTVDGWQNLENVKVDGTPESVEKAKRFLSLYSKQSGGNHDKTIDQYIRYFGRTEELRNVQTTIINEHTLNKPGAKMLTLGPRWSGEIKFLRARFNMNVMGLDLFSSDESCVRIGDMHDVPWDDNTFDIVYEKNTYNKAYDIRKAFDETVRVLKPGGLIMYDECLDYTIGVNENARTNIKTHLWVKNYLGDKIDQVLWDREDPDTANYWINKTGMFAATIKK